MRVYEKKKTKVGDFSHIDDYKDYYKHFGKIILSVRLSKMGEFIETFVYMVLPILIGISCIWVAKLMNTSPSENIELFILSLPVMLIGILSLFFATLVLIFAPYVIFGLFTPIIIVGNFFLYIIDIVKYKKNKITNKHNLVVTFMGDNFRDIVHKEIFETEYEKVLNYLNKKVGLKNGYNTRMYNILESRDGGVYPTVRHFDIDDKTLVLEPELDDKTVIEYFSMLYSDYQIEKEYNENLGYYNELKESEKVRERDLKEARDNIRNQLDKKQEVKGLLFNSKRTSKINGYVKESKQSIKELEEEYDRLRGLNNE